MANSKRQQKYGRQIQKDLSEIFQRDPRQYFGDNLVTLTGVEMSPDLGLAKTYLSVFPIKNSEFVFQRLSEKKGEIKRLLGLRIGKKVRIIPELHFYHDDTEERAEKMDRLIESLKIPPPTDNQEE